MFWGTCCCGCGWGPLNFTNGPGMTPTPPTKTWSTETNALISGDGSGSMWRVSPPPKPSWSQSAMFLQANCSEIDQVQQGVAIGNARLFGVDWSTGSYFQQSCDQNGNPTGGATTLQGEPPAGVQLQLVVAGQLDGTFTIYYFANGIELTGSREVGVDLSGSGLDPTQDVTGAVWSSGACLFEQVQLGCGLPGSGCPLPGSACGRLVNITGHMLCSDVTFTMTLMQPPILGGPSQVSTDGGPVTINVRLLDDSSGDQLTGPITAVGAGNPPTITSAAHGLQNGETIQITGTEGYTTPSLDGVWAVTVYSPDVFSVPTNVTGLSGTPSGSWTRYSEVLTVGCQHGTIELASTSGLAFASGANGTSHMVATGSLSSAQAAVNGMTYTPTGTGSDTMSVLVSNNMTFMQLTGAILIGVNAAPPAGPTPQSLSGLYGFVPGFIGQSGFGAFAAANWELFVDIVTTPPVILTGANGGVCKDTEACRKNYVIYFNAASGFQLDIMPNGGQYCTRDPNYIVPGIPVPPGITVAQGACEIKVSPVVVTLGCTTCPILNGVTFEIELLPMSQQGNGGAVWQGTFELLSETYTFVLLYQANGEFWAASLCNAQQFCQGFSEVGFGMSPYLVSLSNSPLQVAMSCPVGGGAIGKGELFANFTDPDA